MLFKYIILILISLNTLSANSEALELNDEIDNNIGFVNINSDINNTKVYLDGEYIGDTPIERYQVNADTNIELKATADKNYYSKDFIKNINVKKLKIQSYNAKFKRANAKLLLIGKDGYLFIDDRFSRTLGSNNRVVNIPSGKKIKIEIRNGDNKFTVLKDMFAGKFYKLEYNLDDRSIKDKKLQDELVLKDVINIENNTEDKLKKENIANSVTIDALMWQDTKDITTKKLLFKKGQEYCKNLDLEGFKDWSLPTIEQLKGLYKDKDKFYNSFNNNFYWSSTKVKGDYVYWDYISTKNFKEDIITTINGSSNEANQICVRVIKPE